MSRFRPNGRGRGAAGWIALILVMGRAVLKLVQSRQAAGRRAAPRSQTRPIGGPAAATSAEGRGSAAAGVLELFKARVSDTFVEGAGVVVKVLPDDLDEMDGGGFHQRVLVELDGGRGHTILISHNIDSGERVPMVEGDRIAFRGEYEWTEKGGTVHFTHAPKFQRAQPGGWIEHAGVRYE